MKRTLISLSGIMLLLLFTTQMLKAQTDLLFSNSLANPEVYNPSFVQHNGMINARLLNRQQWIGFPDAPKLSYLGVDHFFEGQQMGLKLHVLSQSAGKEVTRRVTLDYIYRVFLKDNIELSFGLGAGFYQRQIQYSKLVYLEGNEPLIRPDENYFRPDFEFGIHLNAGNFSAGYASNHLGDIGKDPSISRIPLHHHLYGVYQFELTDNYMLRTALSYHQQGKVSYVQADAQVFLGILQAGLGWRHLDAVILKAGINITDYIGLHYAYDMGINKLANFNSGTHEVLLQLRFSKPGGTYLSPRFLDY